MRFMKQIVEDILGRTVGKGMIVTARQSHLTDLKKLVDEYVLRGGAG